MIFKCLIVDDEPPARKLLSDYVSRIPGLELAALCTNGLEASEFLRSNSVEILLSDIRMPLMTGIDLLKGMEHQPITIFITAYEEYAVKGYELDVIDYLMKPVSFERFTKAIAKAIEYLTLERSSTGKEEKREYFFIKTDTRIVKFMFSEISAIEAQREYIKIITPGKKVMSLVSLKSIANVLPDDFIRVHRSYVVNMRHIDEVQSNGIIIGKDIYPISWNYRDAFFARLGDMKLS